VKRFGEKAQLASLMLAVVGMLTACGGMEANATRLAALSATSTIVTSTVTFAPPPPTITPTTLAQTNSTPGPLAVRTGTPSPLSAADMKQVSDDFHIWSREDWTHKGIADQLLAVSNELKTLGCQPDTDYKATVLAQTINSDILNPRPGLATATPYRLLSYYLIKDFSLCNRPANGS